MLIVLLALCADLPTPRFAAALPAPRFVEPKACPVNGDACPCGCVETGVCKGCAAPTLPAVHYAPVPQPAAYPTHLATPAYHAPAPPMMMQPCYGFTPQFTGGFFRGGANFGPSG